MTEGLGRAAETVWDMFFTGSAKRETIGEVLTGLTGLEKSRARPTSVGSGGSVDYVVRVALSAGGHVGAVQTPRH